MSKTIYYYQTFVGLHDLMDHAQDIDEIIVSSIHFGKDKSGKKDIHLNDNPFYLIYLFQNELMIR